MMSMTQKTKSLFLLSLFIFEITPSWGLSCFNLSSIKKIIPFSRSQSILDHESFLSAKEKTLSALRDGKSIRDIENNFSLKTSSEFLGILEALSEHLGGVVLVEQILQFDSSVPTKAQEAAKNELIRFAEKLETSNELYSPTFVKFFQKIYLSQLKAGLLKANSERLNQELESTLSGMNPKKRENFLEYAKERIHLAFISNNLEGALNDLGFLPRSNYSTKVNQLRAKIPQIEFALTNVAINAIYIQGFDYVMNAMTSRFGIPFTAEIPVWFYFIPMVFPQRGLENMRYSIEKFRSDYKTVGLAQAISVHQDYFFSTQKKHLIYDRVALWSMRTFSLLGMAFMGQMIYQYGPPAYSAYLLKKVFSNKDGLNQTIEDDPEDEVRETILLGSIDGSIESHKLENPQYQLNQETNQATQKLLTEIKKTNGQNIDAFFTNFLNQYQGINIDRQHLKFVCNEAKYCYFEMDVRQIKDMSKF